MVFQINNYGVQDIDWLIKQYKDKTVTKQSIQQLKDEVYTCFINNPYFDFSTKGNVSVTIVDLQNMTNCEIIYGTNYVN